MVLGIQCFTHSIRVVPGGTALIAWNIGDDCGGVWSERQLGASECVDVAALSGVEDVSSYASGVALDLMIASEGDIVAVDYIVKAI